MDFFRHATFFAPGNLGPLTRVLPFTSSRSANMKDILRFNPLRCRHDASRVESQSAQGVHYSNRRGSSDNLWHAFAGTRSCNEKKNAFKSVANVTFLQHHHQHVHYGPTAAGSTGPAHVIVHDPFVEKEEKMIKEVRKSISRKQIALLTFQLPWLKVVQRVVQSFNFVCTHDRVCHPNCFERVQRQCYRLTIALRKVQRKHLRNKCSIPRSTARSSHSTASSTVARRCSTAGKSIRCRRLRKAFDRQVI